MSSDPPNNYSRLWHGRLSLTVLVLLTLGLTMGIPAAGVIGAFIIAIVVSVIARKHGSFRDMGFRSPESWPRLLGSGGVATWVAVLVGAVPFGVAHLYQGLTGMIATGMIGFVLGAVYVRHGFNLWYAVFTHGFINTVGIITLYLDVDRAMNRWFF